MLCIISRDRNAESHTELHTPRIAGMFAFIIYKNKEYKPLCFQTVRLLLYQVLNAITMFNNNIVQYELYHRSASSNYRKTAQFRTKNPVKNQLHDSIEFSVPMWNHVFCVLSCLLMLWIVFTFHIHVIVYIVDMLWVNPFPADARMSY